MVKKFESHKMIELYQNLCYNKVCYKGTVRHKDDIPNLPHILGHLNHFPNFYMYVLYFGFGSLNCKQKLDPDQTASSGAA